MSDDLYFKQVEVGPMQNFAYLIGSKAARECFVVDPAWETRALVELAERDGMKITGALVTHFHPDHVGGSALGFAVPGGITELIGLTGARIHANKHEGEGLRKVTGVSASDLALHDSGDEVTVGDVAVKLIHTPGHTPGSQCFLVRNRLVSGDTLFVGGCGRVDLPGADPAAMWDSLHNKLAKLPDDVVLYPGHDYGEVPSTTMGEEKQRNFDLKVPTLELWLRMRGGY